MRTPQTGGSINEEVGNFSRFRINELEMVDQTGTSWNLVTFWLRQLTF